MRKKVKGILFDLDGTLINTGKDIVQAVNATLSHFQYPELSFNEIISHIGNGSDNLMRRVFKRENGSVQKELKYYVDYYMDHLMDYSQLYPGVLETLETLKYLPMAVISNKPVAHTELILHQMGIAPYFTIVLGHESLKYAKPSPYPLLKTCERLELEPDQTLMVGDSYTDIDAAVQANMIPVFCQYGLGTLKEQQPAYSINDIRELLYYFE